MWVVSSGSSVKAARMLVPVAEAVKDRMKFFLPYARSNGRRLTTPEG
jgi:hypothetical protein